MTLPIGSGHKVFIICEIGVNHGGSLDTAKRLIDAAVKSGASATKFQAWRTHPADPYASLNLTIDQLADTQAYAKDAGIVWICTPHDAASVDDLEALNVPLYKVGSAGLANPELLRQVAGTRKPVILSTGMATLPEIQRAADIVWPQLVALLKCTNSYPTDAAQMNLRGMTTLRAAFSLPVGLSSHCPGVTDAVLAVGMGAVVLEKHLTLDRAQEGPDHRASETPGSFAAMVQAVRAAEMMLGDGALGPQPAEAELRKQVWGR